MDSDKLKELKKAREILTGCCEKLDAMIAEEAKKCASVTTVTAPAARFQDGEVAIKSAISTIAEKEGMTAGVMAARMFPRRPGE